MSPPLRISRLEIIFRFFLEQKHTLISLLLAAKGFTDIWLPWQNTIAVELGDQRAQRIDSSLCTIVERNIPDLDHILMTPSSLASYRKVYCVFIYSEKSRKESYLLANQLHLDSSALSL